MDLLAAGAGAAEGLDVHLQRLLEQAKLAQLGQIQNRSLDEQSRHNLAEEDIQTRDHQMRSADAQAREREAAQAHEETAASRRDTVARNIADTVPGGTTLPEGDPAISRLGDAGYGGLLRGIKAVNPTALSEPNAMGGESTVSSDPEMGKFQGQEMGPGAKIKLRSSAQIEKEVSDQHAADELQRQRDHDLAMENKPQREANPQPQIFYGADGKPHAIQFVDGKSREIPLDPSLVGKKDPNDPKTAQMRKTGHEAVSRLESDIDKADGMGLIGPASGRIYDQFAKFGTTGDPTKDEMIGRLKSDILLTKMHVDAGIGGTRAAASPLLLKNWEDIAMKSSKDLLHGYTGAIRDDMGPLTGSGAGGGKADLVFDPATGTFKKPE